MINWDDVTKEVCHIRNERGGMLCDITSEPLTHGGRLVATCVRCLQLDGQCVACTTEMGMGIYHENVCMKKLKRLMESEKDEIGTFSEAQAQALLAFRGLQPPRKEQREFRICNYSGWRDRQPSPSELAETPPARSPSKNVGNEKTNESTHHKSDR